MEQRHSDNETRNATADLPASIAELPALVLEQQKQLEQQSLFIELPQATSVDEIEGLLPTPNDSADAAQVS